MSKSKVYLVEVPLKWDSAHRRRVPAKDFTSALEFGELAVLLPPSGGDMEIEDVVAAVVEGMRDFSPNDYLIAGAGHPLAIAAAVMQASRACGGAVRLLHWQRSGGYAAHVLTLPPAEKSVNQSRGEAA